MGHLDWGVRSALLAMFALIAGAIAPPPVYKGLLPAGVHAERYDVTLTPDAANLSFKGVMTATLRLDASQEKIVVDAVDLTIGAASLDGAPVPVALDTAAQTAAFTPAKALGPGRHVLRVAYTGVILRRAAGLFAVDAPGVGGRPQRTLVTQLEPADARRVAPLLDEPGLKAAFALSVIAPRGPAVISNMPIVADEPLGDGLHRVRFAVTPPMASYLLFLAIGDFERTARRVDGVDLGIWTPRGQAARGAFALDTAEAVLRDYDAYFGVRFALPKLDLVVAPGEVGAAMENWGAMLFGASSVLIDPQFSTEADRRATALLVAHEMAHQWFGDLVTMGWWDDLWLNEAFASWRSTKALEELHPQWRPWLAAANETEEAMADDMLPTSHPIERPVTTPGQAAQAFDSTTYEKGQAVVRMIEAYVGPDVFRRAVRRYMRRHAYGVAQGSDFWGELALASGKDVASIARDFTRQPGVPLIEVDADPSGATATSLAQHRLTEVTDGAAGHWRIPLVLTANSPTTLLIDGAATLPGTKHAGALLANAGAVTYARVAYSRRAFDALAERYPELSTADQITLLDDTWALGLTGRRPMSDTLTLIDRLGPNADPPTWRRAIAILAQADDLHDDGPARAALHAWARTKLQPLHARLGWDARADDRLDDAALRSSSLLALARFDDAAVITEARRRFDLYSANDAAPPPEALRTVLRIVSRHADTGVYDAILVLARGAREPTRRETYYGLLGRATDRLLARRTLDLALSSEIPPNTGPAMVLTVAEQHPDIAWRFALAHRDALVDQLDSVSAFDFLPDIAADSYDPARADALLNDAAATLQPPEREPAEKAAALIRLNARVRADRLGEFDRWIGAHG